MLVGQMQTALLEIRGQSRRQQCPERTSFVHCHRQKSSGQTESSSNARKCTQPPLRYSTPAHHGRGSAFPATLAFQIRELERETDGDLKLDAILTVIDAENFAGYEDTSPTARMQASYTDLIIIVSAASLTHLTLCLTNIQNKWEHISDRALDILIDHLNTLNDMTPKIRTEGRNGVDPDLIFGLDSKLYLEKGDQPSEHHDEVETITLFRGLSLVQPEHKHDHTCAEENGCSHSRPAEPERPPSTEGTGDTAPVSEDLLRTSLAKLSTESVWRVKGFVRTERGLQILNWAFGRHELTRVEHVDVMSPSDLFKFTVMGERGEVKRAVRKLAEALGGAMH